MNNSDESLSKFFFEFNSDHLEHQFRQHTLSDDIKSGFFVIFITIASIIIITLLDCLINDFSEYLLKIVFHKIAFISIILLFLFLLKKTEKEKQFDLIIFCLTVSIVFFKLYAAFLRPKIYTQAAVFDVAIIMGIYLIIPARLIYKIIPAIALSIFTPFIAADSFLIVPHMFVHVIGIMFSRILNKNRRDQFLIFLRESELREKLEKSESEVLFISRKLAEQNKVLQDFALKDPLTALSNRRAFYEYAEEQWARAVRKDENYSILIMDIDYFKKVNDTYGHLTGDEVLKTTANIIEQQIRSYDKLGRWGGEEFILCLLEADAEQVKVIAERIKNRIEKEKHISFEQDEFNITVSIGIANKANSDIIDLDVLISQADQALYKAKDLGRNSFCEYKPE